MRRRAAGVVAVVATVIATLATAPPAVAAPGDLDTTFGTAGVVTHDIGDGASLDDATAVAVQSDGKVVVAGGGGAGGDIVVMRLTTAGAPDPTFGTNGLVTVSASSGVDAARAAAIAPDGKIVVVGVAGTDLSQFHQRFVAVRLTPSGALDPTFDSDGIRVGLPASGPFDVIPSDMAILGDGAVYVVGGVGSASGTTAHLVRLRNDGSIDPTFGSGGHHVVNYVVHAMTLWPGGRVVLAATTVSSAPAMVLVRVTPEGVADPSFGIDGETLFAHPANSDVESATTVARDARGGLVIGGLYDQVGGTSGFLIQRASGTGSIDFGFGDGGRSRTAIDGFLQDLDVQSDGRILAVGGIDVDGMAPDRSQPWVVARFDDDGVIDTTFDGDGFAPSPTGVTGAAAAVVIGDGVAYAVGPAASEDFTVARYELGGVSAEFPSDYGSEIIGNRFVATTPTRVLDTRSSGSGQPIPPGGIIDVLVVPSANSPAVVVNITATDATAPGFITVWPAGRPRPNVSSVNLPAAGATVANLVTVGVPVQVAAPSGVDGMISIYSEAGSHVIVDVLGRYTTTHQMTRPGRFEAVAPTRVLDTRSGAPGPQGVDVSLASIPGLPLDQAAAAVLNITATGSTSAGYVTAWPANAAKPDTSNLNVDAAGQTRANQAIVSVGAGTIRLDNTSGAHLLVDVVGYFTNEGGQISSEGLFVPIDPTRAWDTRTGVGGRHGAVGRDEQVDLGIGSGVPFDTAVAIVGNLTATESSAPGYLTLWPTTGGARPGVSSLNLDEARQTRANHVTTPLGDGAQLSIYSETGTHVILDVTGVYRR